VIQHADAAAVLIPKGSREAETNKIPFQQIKHDPPLKVAEKMIFPHRVGYMLVPKERDEWLEFGDFQPHWIFLVDLDQYIAEKTWWKIDTWWFSGFFWFC